MKKQFMSMLLVLCMVLTLFPSTVFAEEAGAAPAILFATSRTAIGGDTIELSGGTVTATTGVGKTPFAKGPSLTGMELWDGSGARDNTTRTASIYENETATVAEQFTLLPGGTYYFDLSAEKNNIGYVNKGKVADSAPGYPGLPDTTLHYVPFTYVGTVNAYSLESDSSGSTGAAVTATVSDRSLFIADYNVSHTYSWDLLNTSGLIFGKPYDTNYKLRSLSVGSSKTELSSVSPSTNEWDSIFSKNNSWIKNYSGLNTWGQDTPTVGPRYRASRGSRSPNWWDYFTTHSSSNIVGWRPALEVLNTATLTSDGMKAVTLNLNGGSFDSNGSVADGVVSSLNIVCAGTTFKAPSGDGLTRPSGDTNTYFSWNTAQDDSGTSYDVGASVPSSVTTLYARWEKLVTGVGLNKSAVSLYSNTNPRSETLTVTIAPADATNKTVTWSSSNTSVATVANGTVTAVANGTATIKATTADGGFTASCTVTVSDYTSGGSVSEGSFSGGSSNIIVTTPTSDNPNAPTQAEIKVDGKTDAGGTTITVTDKNISDAIAKAEAEAKINGNTANGVTIVLSVTGSKNATNVTVNLPKTVQDTIINKKVVSTIIVADNPNVQIGMDLKAVTEINAKANADVNITATLMDGSKLTGTAQAAVGSRPVFDLAVNIASVTDNSSGKQVKSFGAGGVSVSIPYPLGVNEKAGNVCAVYADGSGKVQWLTSSVYDSTAKVLHFSTNHFSTYGVGYKQDAPVFTDSSNHWAKVDIEYAVSRGLLAGTGAATFSPNTAMTRGMFVAALGRLSNADVSGYKTSSFIDVKAGSYYMGYIEWAYKNGIVSGKDGKFMPDHIITREQMAVIMMNYSKTIGVTLPGVHDEKIFTDNAKISGYAKDAVKAMQVAGILRGKSGNVFDPQGAASRAAAAAVLRRFVELCVSIDTEQGWTMNESGKWMYYENSKPVTGTKSIGGTTYTFNQNGETADVPKNLDYTIHMVVKNENWGLIAKQYSCSAAELARVNNKTVFDIIYPGDELKVPQEKSYPKELQESTCGGGDEMGLKP